MAKDFQRPEIHLRMLGRTHSNVEQDISVSRCRKYKQNYLDSCSPLRWNKCLLLSENPSFMERKGISSNKLVGIYELSRNHQQGIDFPRELNVSK